MSLIINSPYVKPEKHWVSIERGKPKIKNARRPANYVVFDIQNNTTRTEELELVNIIRNRVDQWRNDNYPGITIITRKLLEHWHDQTMRELPFYFCQLEAIETLIWWIEGEEAYKQGIHIPGDGGLWERLCNKMATGTGKTAVMAMIITWQVLNAVTYVKHEKRFSKAVFIVTPGLTVKERLQVLIPSENSYYDEFNLCPSEALRQRLNQAEILIENWHVLMPYKDKERSVVQKGKESDEVFTFRVLGRLANYKNIVVINDEAHHAYRKPPDAKISKKQAQEQGVDLDNSTRWIEGLDRIHKTCRIRCSFDLSATPFAPTGKKSTESTLFNWIISDFGLNDAIEAGLVKTPRIVVRDDALPDAKTLKSKLYHLFRDPAVHEDLNRNAEPHEVLPKLVKDAYTILGADWRETAKAWESQGYYSPPVMLTVCNGTSTAARIEHYFNSGDNYWPELCAPNKTLRVDSKVLAKAETGEAATANKAYEERLKDIVSEADLLETQKLELKFLKKEELLREIVDNVGKPGTVGQYLQKVISVSMLSEGWDAKNVTHIMGLRAFSSQLLCEQVVGRGLRRISYDIDENGLFLPEYVNVFGVPLTIYESGQGNEGPPPPKPATQVEVVDDRASLEIKWPNVARVEIVVNHELNVNWEKMEPLILDPAATPVSAELAPALGNIADLGGMFSIDLEKLPEGFRLQRLMFQAARKAFSGLSNSFKGCEEQLGFQLVRLIEHFLYSPALRLPSKFHSEPLRKRILIALNIDLIVQYLMTGIYEQNSESYVLLFEEEQPIGSTALMRTWHTTRPVFPCIKSHISHVVGDSSWEGYAASLFEKSDKVRSYVKNERMGFKIYYLWAGSKRLYMPDFLIRLTNGSILILEIKGQDSPQNKAKRDALTEWVKAVNLDGRFGKWSHAVAFTPHEIYDIIENHGSLELFAS